MPLIRPNLDELYAQAKTLINIYLPGADANLERNVLNIIAIIVSQMSNGQYGYIAYLGEQIFALTCDRDSLLKLCAIRGVIVKAAEKATGNFTATGNDGSVISAGTQVQRLDGVIYNVTADATIASGTALVNIEAQEVGINANAAASTQLIFISPPPGVNTAGTVDTNGITGGTNEEDTEELRARYLDIIRTPPQGGAKNDYEIWAREVAGVTKAFVYPLENGYGTVAVRFLVEPTISNPNGIPSPSQVTAVQNYIETVRPVTAKNITVEAPDPIPLNFNIKLEVNDNSDVRAAVITQLKAMLLRDAKPQGKTDSGVDGTIYLSRISEAVSLATGEFAHKIISPTDDVTYTLGQIAVYGDTTFTT